MPTAAHHGFVGRRAQHDLRRSVATGATNCMRLIAHPGDERVLRRIGRASLSRTTLVCGSAECYPEFGCLANHLLSRDVCNRGSNASGEPSGMARQRRDGQGLRTYRRVERAAHRDRARPAIPLDKGELLSSRTYSPPSRGQGGSCAGARSFAQQAASSRRGAAARFGPVAAGAGLEAGGACLVR